MKTLALGFLCLIVADTVAAAPVRKAPPEIQAAVKAHKKGVVAGWDELKERLELWTDDNSALNRTIGTEIETITMSWVSGNAEIAATFQHSHYGDFDFVQSCEVYVGKDLVATAELNPDYRQGDWSAGFGTHHKIETIKANLTFDQAAAIAHAEHKNITLRFYGREGYTDRKPSKHMYGFRNLLAIARRLSADS